MKPVAVVQHEGSVPPGLIADVLDAGGRDGIVIEAWRDVTWPSTTDISGLVVLGGTMNVDQLDGYPFLKQSRDLMADAIDRDIPTLGVCLGSQMMARVLGSDVYRATPRSALFSQLELTEHGARDPLTAPFADVEVLQFHEDTFAVPEGAIALATSASTGLAQAFRFGHVAYAFQFHFEVDRGILEGWLHNIGRREMVDDWGVSDEELLANADDLLAKQRTAGAELLRRFLDLPTAL